MITLFKMERVVHVEPAMLEPVRALRAKAQRLGPAAKSGGSAGGER
jgi:hypothetical protein